MITEQASILPDKADRRARASVGRAADNASLPSAGAVAAACSVSVVIPCYNEERFIGKALESLIEQYDGEGYEIVVVDGRSEDKTREVVAEFAAAHPQVAVRVFDNPQRSIPAALNIGIGHARGEIIARMDAHSAPAANYVRRCVELLRDGGAAVAGMSLSIRPGDATQTARAVALTVAHPFGIGDAKYRTVQGASARVVDTVPFGAFRKQTWEEVGGFNEELLTNEDYEFYYRIRQRGGLVVMDESAACFYFARATLTDLARQYARYGGWKARMIKLHPRSIKLRQMVAPAFVAALLVLGTLGAWWTPALWLLLGAVVAPYAALSLYFAYRLARRAGELSLLPLLSLAFFVIHTTWGASFLFGLIRSPKN
ncbi:MAG TPA: glycosyltransferase family 2 protein [Pyrinomonadaceae bacterium]